MNVKSFAKLMVLMLVATMALEASAAETDSFRCKARCALKCLTAPDEELCYAVCRKGCPGGSEVETLEGQCNLECVVSKCFDTHPDIKKVKGCVNSCSEGCKNV